MSFSDYIVYVDESGDHSLDKINTSYPIFVLSFCIFNKEEYVQSIAPSVQKFKFKFFGHDMVILHEREIRKQEGDFKILFNSETRKEFQKDLSSLMGSAHFTVISSVIRKDLLHGDHDENPYHIALKFCLESLNEFLPNNSNVHLVFEKRGKKEDKELELEFRRICDGNNRSKKVYPFHPIMVSKASNSTGLQLADMIARPIGVKQLRPNQKNRAYDIIADKFYTKAGDLINHGLHVTP